MKALVNTYHYSGSLNARRLLDRALTQSGTQWQPVASSYLREHRALAA